MAKTATTEKIVLRENKVQSDNFLTFIEREILSLIRTIAGKIRNLNIEVDKELLRATINGDLAPLKAKVEANLEAEENEFVREQRKKILDEHLSKIRHQVAALAEVNPKNFGLDEKVMPSVEDLWQIEEKGNISIIPAKADEIRDKLREYVLPGRVPLAKAHQKAAKAVEEFLNALSDAGMRDKIGLTGFIAGATMDIREEENYRFTVVPKPLDYNLLKPVWEERNEEYVS